MSLIWWHERNGNENRVAPPSAVSSKKVLPMPRRRMNWKERAATAFMVLAALYFLGHIIAAWMRGSFGGWR